MPQIKDSKTLAAAGADKEDGRRPTIVSAPAAAYQAGAFFVTRAKINMKYHRVYSRPVDKSTGLGADQSIALDGFYTRRNYPGHLRRVHFCDPETGKRLVFLTNNFMLPALTIAALYKQRWQVELFFKWIKQHL